MASETSPFSVRVAGRPSQLRMQGERRNYLLHKNICGRQSHCLIKARLAAESAAVVPVDQIEATANQTNALVLPRGKFIVEVEDVQGKQITSFDIAK